MKYCLNDYVHFPSVIKNHTCYCTMRINPGLLPWG